MQVATSSETERWKRIGRCIAIARQDKALKLEALAAMAHLDEKTVRTVINGERVRESSLRAICGVLGLDVNFQDEAPEIAGEQFGGYNLNHYKEYIGHFWAYRRRFTETPSLVRSLFSFTWCGASGQSRLCFSEKHRYEAEKQGRFIDSSQNGDVHISNETHMVQLLTANKGALRLISLTRLDTEDYSMSGIVLTSAKRPHSHLPSTSAIILRKIAPFAAIDVLERQVGPLFADDSDYSALDDALSEVEQNVGIFALSR